MTMSTPSSSSNAAVDAPLAISNREEDELRKQVRAEALKECDPVVKAFADCATGRTVSVAWACRPQYREVQACMKRYLGEESMKERKRIYLQEKRNRGGS